MRKPALSALLVLTLLIGFVAGGCGDEEAGLSRQPPQAPPAREEIAGPSSETPLLRTFVIVVDGMMPDDIRPGLTPAICRVIHCPGTAAPDPGSHATVYAQARAIMLAQTNANHVAMVSGAYADASGIFGNSFYNRRRKRRDKLERPALLLVPTLFDAAAQARGAPRSSPGPRGAPPLTTAAVMGKVKLRGLFDCTREDGACGTSDANPERRPVTHARPDFLEGGAVQPAPGSDDCPVQPPTPDGVAQDACITERVIRLVSEHDPTFTFVNLGQVDQVQHQYGPASPEAYAAVAEADRQVGRLVAHLQESGKWKTSVLFLLSDHSFSDEGTGPAQRIDLQALFRADRQAHPAAWGTHGGIAEKIAVVPNGGVAGVTLVSLPSDAEALTPAQADALARMRQVALFAAPGERRAGISEALYRLPDPADPGHTLAEVHPDWHLDTARAGDLIVTALASGADSAGGNPYEAESGPGSVLVATDAPRARFIGDHGHPGTRHILFLIASGGDFVVDQVIAPSNPGAVNEGDDTAALPEQAETVDVAPTILWLNGMIPPDAGDARALLPASRGRVLKEAFVDGVPPGGAR